ncbi:MAG: hypothetical protein AVDCRST_MAG33-10, partial [uncultured Thermomicrobiales bacterium]
DEGGLGMATKKPPVLGGPRTFLSSRDSRLPVQALPHAKMAPDNRELDKYEYVEDGGGEAVVWLHRGSPSRSTRLGGARPARDHHTIL